MINNKNKIVLDDLKIQSTKRNNLSKIEGILTSTLQIKWPKAGNPYYLGFFQLEGIEQDIPIIFKLDSSENWAKNKPNIPPRAKVLLEGKWADSLSSPRASFTCLAFQVISNPPPPTIKSLREQINSLLTISLTKKQEWTQRTDYLFKRIDYLKDLERLSKLGSQYLEAYLLLKSASYANYQDNLLPETTDLTQPNNYLAKIQSELEDIAYQVRAYEAVSKKDNF